MRRTLPLLAALAFASSLALPAATPPAPAPAPTPAPTVKTPGLPPGVHPLSPALAQHMDELVHAAEEYRGLRLKRPVPYGSLDEKMLKAKVAESIEEDLPADQMRALSLSLQAFGLLPEGADVGKIYGDLLGQQVAAFYDPERKYLAMVERQDVQAALGKTLGADSAARAEEGILVHELTHAIDDQHFDIGKGSKGDPLVDESAAYLSLVEGDATVTMFSYILGKRVDSVPGFGQVLGNLLKDPRELASLSPDLPGSADLAAAPAWFRDTLVFSYFQGFSFCLDVERAGGQKLLDYAFTKDPPRSTEQILHPEKWRGQRDDPIGLTWPDLTAVLPGWKKGAEGQMGEEGIAILLRQERKVGKSSIAFSGVAGIPAAAAGWGGDRFAVYEKGGKRLLLWLTEWDTEADAAEFEAAAARLPSGNAGWKVSRLAPTRVVLSRGDLAPIPPERQTRVEAALAAVRAERPANRNIDLAALGIAPSPAPQREKAKKPARELHADGRTFTDRAAGFSIRLPALHEGWSIVPAVEGPSRVHLVEPEKGVLVDVRVDDLKAPPAKLDEILEAWRNEKVSPPDVRLVDSGVVAGSGTRAYERQLEGADGKRTLDRQYAHGAKRITLRASVPGGAWKDVEGAIREVFDSLALLP